MTPQEEAEDQSLLLTVSEPSDLRWIRSSDNFSSENYDDFFSFLNVTCSDSPLTRGGWECVCL